LSDGRLQDTAGTIVVGRYQMGIRLQEDGVLSRRRPTAERDRITRALREEVARRPHALDVFVPSAAVASGPEPTGM
jgi:hypothetical protein